MPTNDTTISRRANVNDPCTPASIFLAMFLVTAPGGTGAAQEIAIAPAFEEVGHFHEGIAPALSNGKWGFIDTTGKWLLAPAFDKVQAGRDGRFGVEVDKRWGYLNTSGTMVVAPRYDAVKPFSGGMAAVKKNGKWGYVSPSGKVLDEHLYVFAGQSFDGYRLVMVEDGELLLIDARVVSLPEESFYGHSISEAGSFAENGWAPIRTAVGWYFTSVNGGIKPDEPLQQVRPFSENLAAVSEDGRNWGFIDIRGSFVIPARYEAAREFSQGVAPVKIKGKWGLVGRDGKLALPARYDDIYSVREGWAVFRNGNRRGFLRVSSPGDITEAVPEQFENVFSSREGLAPVKLGGRWGFLKLGAGNEALIRDIAILEAE